MKYLLLQATYAISIYYYRLPMQFITMIFFKLNHHSIIIASREG